MDIYNTRSTRHGGADAIAREAAQATQAEAEHADRSVEAYYRNHPRPS